MMFSTESTDTDILEYLKNISEENNVDKFNESYTKLYETENFKHIKDLLEKKIVPEKIAKIEEKNEFPEDPELERILKLSEEEYEEEVRRRFEEMRLMDNAHQNFEEIKIDNNFEEIKLDDDQDVNEIEKIK
jgi:hypothetical protein